MKFPTFTIARHRWLTVLGVSVIVPDPLTDQGRIDAFAHLGRCVPCAPIDEAKERERGIVTWADVMTDVQFREFIRQIFPGEKLWSF